MAIIEWSQLALDDLTEIYTYISHDSTLYAKRYTDGIIRHVEQLINNPFSGRIVPEFDKIEIRELLYRNHRIVYLMQEKSIFILRISHTSRLLSSLQ